MGAREIQRTEINASAFWSQVGPTDPVTGCRLWRGRIDRGRYGSMKIAHGRTRLAHRIAWAMTFGVAPKDQLVCHHCDVPLCVEPTHLFLGSVQDNILDALRKGRLSLPTGRMLTSTQLQGVRRLAALSLGTTAIARRCGLSPQSVSGILLGQRYTAYPWGAPQVDRGRTLSCVARLLGVTPRHLLEFRKRGLDPKGPGGPPRTPGIIAAAWRRYSDADLTLWRQAIEAYAVRHPRVRRLPTTGLLQRSS